MSWENCCVKQACCLNWRMPVLTEESAVYAANGRQKPESVMLPCASWEAFEQLDRFFEGSPVRLRYADGVIEFMSISSLHERIKQRLSHLISHFCVDNDIEYTSEGSATRRLVARRNAEPDDSFYFGAHASDGSEVPDVALEVALTSGGLDKLKLYEPLGIPELWIYENGTLRVVQLQNGSYTEAAKSQFLPTLDMRLLGELAARDISTSAMLKEFRSTLK